jgi:hypothetical protein
VVAPASKGTKGVYSFIEGGLDDLDNLPVMRGLEAKPADGHIPEGKRDDTLFRRLLREVRHCDDFESRLDVARTLNMNCVPPMSDAQVVSKATQAWKYETSGTNWVGRKARASTDRDEILALSGYPNAALLLSLLRVSHPMPGDQFAIAQVETANLLGWSRETLRASINALITTGRLVRVHYAGQRKGDPHLYRLCRGRRESV